MAMLSCGKCDITIDDAIAESTDATMTNILNELREQMVERKVSHPMIHLRRDPNAKGKLLVTMDDDVARIVQHALGEHRN